MSGRCCRSSEAFRVRLPTTSHVRNRRFKLCNYCLLTTRAISDTTDQYAQST